MEKTRVLIFPQSTQIAEEVKRSLAGSTHFEMICLDTDPSGPIKTTVFEDENVYEVVKAAYAYSACVIPCHDELIEKLAQHGGCDSVFGYGTPSKSVEIMRDKLLTYQTLKEVANVPEIYTGESDPEFPVFMKPRKGQGSKGCAIIRHKDDENIPLDANPNTHIFCEYLPGREYTVDMISNSGNILFMSPRIRIETTNGIATTTELIDESHNQYNSIKLMANSLQDRLNINGSWFFQCKEDKYGVIKLLEVSPRISGSSGINRLNGVNSVLISLFIYMGLPVSIINQKIVKRVTKGLGTTNYTFYAST